MPPTTQLDELLLEWEDRHRRGEPCTPEDLCRDRPDLLEPFRQRLADLQQMLSFVASSNTAKIQGGKTGSYHPNAP